MYQNGIFYHINKLFTGGFLAPTDLTAKDFCMKLRNINFLSKCNLHTKFQLNQLKIPPNHKNCSPINPLNLNESLKTHVNFLQLQIPIYMPKMSFIKLKNVSFLFPQSIFEGFLPLYHPTLWPIYFKINTNLYFMYN